MKIQYVDISTIKTFKFNPADRINEEKLVELEKSIQKDGIINPMQLGVDQVLGDGNRRLAVAKKLGFTKVPVVQSDTLTGEQLYALNATHKPHKGKEWYEAVVKGFDIMLVPDTQRRLIQKLRDVLKHKEWIKLGMPPGTAPTIYQQARRIGTYTGRTSGQFTRLHVLWIKKLGMSNRIRKAMEIACLPPSLIMNRIDNDAPITLKDLKG